MHTMQDPQYHSLFDAATQMQYKFHDFTAGEAAHHPEARELQNEIHQLVQDIATEKNPRSIEQRIKTIQHELESAKHSGSLPMSFMQHDVLHDHFEDMRNNVRKFSHY